MHFGSRRLTALLVIPVVMIGACSSSKAKSKSSTITTDVGVQVAGAFGTEPKVTVPGKAAPAALTQQTLSEGKGATLAKGDTLIANYVGQTWAPKNGKPNVFDTSFTKKPVAFVIGVGAVIPGWDKTLVGKKLGSRVLLTLPPSEGYGAKGQAGAGIGGTDTLVFIVDLVTAFKPDASGQGTVVANLPAGLPKLTNVPGKPPVIISVAGVKAPAKATDTLIVTGTGAPIDPTKTLVLQLVQADLKSGKGGQSTWGKAPQTVAAKNVLDLAASLTGQKIGSRSLVLLPATPAIPASGTQPAQAPAAAQVLLIDVVGQY